MCIRDRGRGHDGSIARTVTLVTWSVGHDPSVPGMNANSTDQLESPAVTGHASAAGTGMGVFLSSATRSAAPSRSVGPRHDRSPLETHLETQCRTVHLIDVENLCGVALPTDSYIAETLHRYRRSVTVDPEDHVILGGSGVTAFGAGRAWPGVSVVAGSGKDGADLALLQRCDVQHFVARFERVVIASGDHIFAPLVGQLLTVGLRVVVLARSDSLSWRLRRSGAQIHHFEIPTIRPERDRRSALRFGRPLRHDPSVSRDPSVTGDQPDAHRADGSETMRRAG